MMMSSPSAVCSIRNSPLSEQNSANCSASNRMTGRKRTTIAPSHPVAT